MFGESLLSIIEEESSSTEVQKGDSIPNFINRIEGWKTRCKNLHWSAPKKNIHEYLDDFLDILSDYQDNLAEVYQGIAGQFAPNMLKGIPCDALNAQDFINEIDIKTREFYSALSDDVNYVGIKSECETFINNIKKYIYLFRLTDIKPY